MPREEILPNSGTYSLAVRGRMAGSETRIEPRGHADAPQRGGFAGRYTELPRRLSVHAASVSLWR